jgi:hypothetical protein
MRRTAELAIPGEALWLKAGKSSLSARNVSSVTRDALPSVRMTLLGIVLENSSARPSMLSVAKSTSVTALLIMRVVSCAVMPRESSLAGVVTRPTCGAAGGLITSDALAEDIDRAKAAAETAARASESVALGMRLIAPSTGSASVRGAVSLRRSRRLAIRSAM